MLTVELASLREDEIRGYINAETPEGWTFQVDQSGESRLWEASFQDASGVLQWEIADITLKQVLLHALGWLEIRKFQLPEGSRWVRRSGEIQRCTQDRAYQVTTEGGPEDLEVVEISSVYSTSRRGGK